MEVILLTISLILLAIACLISAVMMADIHRNRR